MSDAPRIAVLQTGRTIPEALRDHGDYDVMCKRMVGRTAEQATTYAVLDGQFPDSLDTYDVLVITGSKHGVYENHPWIAPLEVLIRKAMKEDKRLIGICFGHQIMAQALGGRAEKSEKGLGVGLMDYTFFSDDGTQTPMRLYAWHGDQVTQVPPGAKIIAASDFCPIAGLRYGDQAISIQPHPEFTKGYMQALLTARRGTAALPEELAVRADRSLEKPASTADAEAMLQNFMAMPACPSL